MWSGGWRGCVPSSKHIISSSQFQFQFPFPFPLEQFELRQSTSCRRIMLSSSSMAFSMPTATVSDRFTNSTRSLSSITMSEPRGLALPRMPNINLSPSRVLEFAFPLAASISILLWTNPAHAGFLSGSTGLESIPGPELPQFNFLKEWNENNQRRYAELDSKFKSSTVLKELLEKSKLNKERNRKDIQDKYCLRGAEWGVGDCSTQGMTQEEKDEFISMLKKKAGE